MFESSRGHQHRQGAAAGAFEPASHGLDLLLGPTDAEIVGDRHPHDGRQIDRQHLAVHRLDRRPGQLERLDGGGLRGRCDVGPLVQRGSHRLRATAAEQCQCNDQAT